MRDNNHIDYDKYLLPHSPPCTPLFNFQFCILYYYFFSQTTQPNIPGCPIISGCDCPTDNLSKYIDRYLKPLVPLIKDTKLFSTPSLSHLSTPTYPPTKELSHARRPPLQHFRTLLDFILKHNYFLFNNQHYLQIQGTAWAHA